VNLVNLVEENNAEKGEEMEKRIEVLTREEKEELKKITQRKREEMENMSKGVINGQGHLIIFRGGRRGWVNVRCYLTEKEGHKENSDFPRCGDECSLFGNPDQLPTGKTLLSLCKKTWVFDEFNDERVEKKGK